MPVNASADLAAALTKTIRTTGPCAWGKKYTLRQLVKLLKSVT